MFRPIRPSSGNFSYPIPWLQLDEALGKSPAKLIQEIFAIFYTARFAAENRPVFTFPTLVPGPCRACHARMKSARPRLPEQFGFGITADTMSVPASLSKCQIRGDKRHG